MCSDVQIDGIFEKAKSPENYGNAELLGDFVRIREIIAIWKYFTRSLKIRQTIKTQKSR
nr:MAG TPA: hypothetical protein [Caudoviricetes sp.]